MFKTHRPQITERQTSKKHQHRAPVLQEGKVVGAETGLGPMEPAVAALL